MLQVEKLKYNYFLMLESASICFLHMLIEKNETLIIAAKKNYFNNNIGIKISKIL